MRSVRVGVLASSVVAVGLLVAPGTAGAAGAPPADEPVTPRSLLTDVLKATADEAARIGDALVDIDGTTVPQDEVLQAVYGWYQSASPELG